eukprot:750716-Hanusia_phi.AAC.2
MAGQTRLLYQGLFNAPMVVGEAIKGATLLADVMSQLGYETNPPIGTSKTDIICALKLLNRENLLAFCRAVQRNSPVGSYIVPEPGSTVTVDERSSIADEVECRWGTGTKLCSPTAPSSMGALLS